MATVRNVDKTPFYKRSWFLGLSAVIALGGMTLALFGNVKTIFLSPKPAAPAFENAEIVIDSSAQMQRPFEGAENALRAAGDAVTLVLQAEGLARDNLAMRTFGGDCGELDRGPDVPFGVTNERAVRTTVGRLRPSGAPTLIHAVLQAIEDFNDVARFKDVSKRIIVIAGSADGCRLSPELVERKLARLKEVNSTIKLDFHYLGVGLTEAAKAELVELSKRSGSSDPPIFAQNRQQLEEAVRGIMVVEPVVRGAEAVLGILNTSVKEVNPVIESLNASNFAAGTKGLEVARADFGRSELPFADLGKRQTTEQFRQIYDAANRNRDLQRQAISLIEKMLAQKQAGNETGLQASVVQFESVRTAYNDQAAKLVAQVNQLGTRSH